MTVFAPFLSRAERIRPVRKFGKVTEIQGDTISVRGLNGCARIGDRVMLECGGGEILRLGPDDALILPESTTEGQAIGTPVEHLGANTLAPDDSWIGQVPPDHDRSDVDHAVACALDMEFRDRGQANAREEADRILRRLMEVGR